MTLTHEIKIGKELGDISDETLEKNAKLIIPDEVQV